MRTECGGGGRWRWLRGVRGSGSAVYANQDDEDCDGAFDDPYAASLSLFVLLTTENYPDIMLPALHHSKPLCLVYFLSFFMLVVWLVMSLFLAIVFDNFKSIHTRKVLRAHVSERRSLLTAFLILQVRVPPPAVAAPSAPPKRCECFIYRIQSGRFHYDGQPIIY